MERHHDVLSDLELHTLWHLQLLNPADVREGVPLLLEGVEPEFEWSERVLGTLAIAKSLGIRHPAHTSEEPKRLTTDFLVTLRDRRKVAVHVKYAKDLDERRNKQLRAIEEDYWLRRQVRFKVITEADLNRTAIGNLGMFASCDKADVGGMTDEWLSWLVIAARETPMSEVLGAASKFEGTSYVTLVNRVKYACLLGLVRPDLTKRVLEWTSVWPPMSLASVPAIGDAHEEVPHV